MNTTLTITLDRPVYGGYCLGRHEGKAVMVPYGIPGETVSVIVTEDKKDFCFASIQKIMDRHAERIEPECPYFTRCGGCAYLHVPYGRELEFKKAIVTDSLARIAGLDSANLPATVLVSADRFHYRSHATVTVKGGTPGFFRKGTNDFVPVGRNGCLLLAGELNQWLRGNRSLPGDCRIAVDSSLRVITSLDRDPVATDNACGLVFSRGLNCFFQANRLLRERMLEIAGECAAIDSSETFLDTGCGVGFFTLFLAGRASSCTGIDISSDNIRWAKQNASLNRIPNAEFLAMPSNRIHPNRISADIIVSDPPRAGMDRKTRQSIMAMEPSALVYVSCNPATFSRDAKDFVRGGYILEQLTLIDMFPGTHHIELISRFTRNAVSRRA